MNKTIKQWMMPVFGLAVGISFVAAEAYAAKESVDLTGRARGWLKSGSTQEDKDGKSISKMEFEADARIGVTVSTTEGDWTGAAMAELATHEAGRNNDATGPLGYRDAWASIGNKSFDLKVGRQWHGDYCVTAYYPIGLGGGDCVGGLLARDQGASVSLKGLPVSLSASFVARTQEMKAGNDRRVGINDQGTKDVLTDDAIEILPKVNAVVGNVTGFNVRGSAEVAGATISAIFGSKDIKGSKELSGGDSAAATAEGMKDNNQRFGLLGAYTFGNITVSGGFGSNTQTTNTGVANADDVKTTAGKFLIAGAFDLGDGMGVGGFIDQTNTKADTTGAKTSTLQNLTLGFQKSFASTNANIGFHQQTKNDEEDGNYTAFSGFALGLQSSF